MNIRMILWWAVFQIPITGYCSEWIYVTRDTMGDEFFVDRASFEQDEYKIFFRGLRNYSSPEKRLINALQVFPRLRVTCVLDCALQIFPR